MNTPTRTALVRIRDDRLRQMVIELAEQAGAHVPADPWQWDPREPATTVILGPHPSGAALADIDPLAAERALAVTDGSDCGLPAGIRSLRLPEETEAFLAALASGTSSAAVVSIIGLHGGAGATRLAAVMAQLLAKQDLRTILVDADPRGGAGYLLRAHDEWEKTAATWASVDDGEILPLRLWQELPRWERVGVLTGSAPPPTRVNQVVNQLRSVCDVIVVDGAAHPSGHQIAVGCADQRSVRGWLRMPPDAARVLVLRRGYCSAAEVAQACGAGSYHQWPHERQAYAQLCRGIDPGHSPRSAVTMLARALISDWQGSK
ncbi:MAG: hypothetical protein Q4B12_02925 [Bowdeniella nasicola]|nr:hypothetical protein [Bowdeniella nasicola]